jgi:uncharacterized BrkB/YihY/UPF0761 family membrane protein
MNKSPPIKTFFKEIYKSWITDRPARLAASLANFGMFPFAPITNIAQTVAGLFIDELAMANCLYCT